MPRPTTKENLLELSEKNFRKLLSFVDTLHRTQQEGEFILNGRDQNVRDVFCHLEAWHHLMERWHEEGSQGKTPFVPAEGYTWRTLPAMNREIWKACQTISLEESRRKLEASHGTMQTLISSHSQEELFAKNVYAWTKTTTLGAYFVSATSSHYDWALKTLKPIAKLAVRNESGPTLPG